MCGNVVDNAKVRKMCYLCASWNVLRRLLCKNGIRNSKMGKSVLWCVWVADIAGRIVMVEYVCRYAGAGAARRRVLHNYRARTDCRPAAYADILDYADRGAYVDAVAYYCRSAVVRSDIEKLRQIYIISNDSPSVDDHAHAVTDVQPVAYASVGVHVDFVPHAAQFVEQTARQRQEAPVLKHAEPGYGCEGVCEQVDKSRHARRKPSELAVEVAGYQQ